MFKNNTDKYLYRRQYILGPRFDESLENWQKIKISKEYYLTAHRDLNVTECHFQNRSIFLLGYLIDPFNTAHNDSQIIRRIIQNINSIDDIYEELSEKCGRFVMIVLMGSDFRIFSDTCGLRQVFYCVDQNGTIWCASQPHLIAKQLSLKVCEEVRNDLKTTLVFNTAEYWYPGRLSLYNEIFHLLPNHYFDMHLKKSIRYWPNKRLNSISMPECVGKVTQLLSGIIEGAVNRFSIAFAISSGLDSRTLLAVSKKVSKEIQYFSQCEESDSTTNPDVLIPSIALKELGLKHDVVILPKEIDQEFKNLLEKNVLTARIVKGINAYAIHEKYNSNNREIVVLYGNCSEITKRDRFRFPKLPAFLLNGNTLAAMAFMSGSYFAVAEFNRWLQPLKKLTHFNIDILDLMHWEQRVGNWGAMTFSELDIVFDSICPYNCRKYIEYMLSVPFKYRTRPAYQLHHKIINSVWPEILQYPINPEKNRIKKGIEDFLYWTNIYDIVKYFHIMFYKKRIYKCTHQ